ncbi:Uncharacterized protein FWK35_00026182 [Aphis craccivora]|uniref:Uncharacterized protein n=1 Tax=Aphis craccivora TaxID=307492 RepID=A0A6G0VVJ4_APHCR|nr:Uncharacterized protein FWK35_00026182 [Aphis craccivora]
MKFIEQRIKLAVENVEPTTSFESYRHGMLLPNTIRALVVDIHGIQLFTSYENEKVIEPEEALPNSIVACQY